VIRLDTEKDPGDVTITFIDSGVPFNPLAVEEPDVTLSAKDRKVGGLGIFMVKRSMDDVAYEYADNKNILTIKKNI
jgi:anti-sigma regulatory factor (Ser/Thr protein kinase)